MKQYAVCAAARTDEGDGRFRPDGNRGRFSGYQDGTGSAWQYSAALTVANPAAGTRESGTASVNAPAVLYGYKFFQNSVGWGADVRVLENGEELQTEALCAGSSFR